MTNRTAGASMSPKGPATEHAKVRQSVQNMTKQIDRTRKAIKRLQAQMPDAPALLRAQQFMATHGLTEISQTRWIKTTSQLREYQQFLNRFDKYSTRTVRGAKAAQKKQLNSLENIMNVYGWDPKVYSVNDFYKELNKLDLYTIMNDYKVSSDEIVASSTIIMNTTKGRKLTASALLTEIFGHPVATPQSLTKYKKGTTAHRQMKARQTKARKGK